MCALFGDLNTETQFTKLHEKREDALYQSLFLNRRLIQSARSGVPARPRHGDLPAGETITAHHPVMLAALGIRESDLVFFKELTKATDGTDNIHDNPNLANGALTKATSGVAYITDDLKLANLSFLWRHAWLAKTLKFKAEEWRDFLKIFSRTFAPSAARGGLEVSGRDRTG